MTWGEVLLPRLMGDGSVLLLLLLPLLVVVLHRRIQLEIGHLLVVLHGRIRIQLKLGHLLLSPQLERRSTWRRLVR